MPFLAEVGNATLALTLSLVLTIGLILWQTQRQWRQSLRRPRWSDESETWTGPPAVTPDDLARWEVRMHELTRDLQGQLNTKIALLAELVAQADQLARRLEQLLDTPGLAAGERAKSDSKSSNEASTGSELVHVEKTCFDHPKPEALLKSVPAGQEIRSKAGGQSPVFPGLDAGASELVLSGNGSQPHRETILPASRASLPPGTIQSTVGDQDSSSYAGEGTSRFAPVYELLITGLSPAEVAARTGVAVGEVELALRVLNLRRSPKAE